METYRCNSAVKKLTMKKKIVSKMMATNKSYKEIRNNKEIIWDLIKEVLLVWVFMNY